MIFTRTGLIPEIKSTNTIIALNLKKIEDSTKLLFTHLFRVDSVIFMPDK